MITTKDLPVELPARLKPRRVNQWLRAAVVFVAFTCNANADTKEDLSAVRERLEAITRELNEAEQSRSEAVDQLRDSERAISETNRKLHELNAARDDVKQSLKELSNQSESTRSKINKQQDAIARILRQQYMHGSADPLRLLIANEDPNAVARQVRYLSYVSRARADLIAALKDNLSTLQRLTESTKERNTELAQIEKRHGEERLALERERADRQKILSNVAEQISQRRQEFANLKKDEGRLTQLLEKIARAMAEQRKARKAKPKPLRDRTKQSAPEPEPNNTTFDLLRGRGKLPVMGELVSRFGGPRSQAGFSGKGVFIRAAAGEDVKAVADGQVVFADWLRGFGNMVIVDHGGGYMSLYGNNEAMLKRAGDTVRTGETIGTVGASGGSQETGVYFEIRHQGRPIDPLHWARHR